MWKNKALSSLFHDAAQSGDCSKIRLEGCKHIALKKKAATTATPKPQETWQIAAFAADDKKAIDLKVLDLREVTSFADHFIVCSGSNPRQIQTISDEVGKQLAEVGLKPKSLEGYSTAEWILMDYGDFVVHVFSEQARTYYDLERLWRTATEVDWKVIA
jgi:ribosome-associated protein